MTVVNINPLQIHPFSIEQDVPRLLSLLAAVEAADQEGTALDEKELHQQLELAGHDPNHNRWVINHPVNPGEMIATALVHRYTESGDTLANIIVHPGWRHQGIGEKLLSNVMRRANELHANSILIFADVRNAASAEFLGHHGFAAQGAYTELRLPADTRLPPIVWPFGYTLRTYAEVQDVALLTEAMNLSYVPLWGHHEVSREQMESWLPGFVPGGIFLVFSEKGRVVGISRTEPSAERTARNGAPTGYIDAPGIVPQHRRLDLYRALVLSGVRWLRQQGQSIIEMESWGDKLEVLKMYRELGFVDIHQRVCYQRKVMGDKNGVPSSA